MIKQHLANSEVNAYREQGVVKSNVQPFSDVKFKELASLTKAFIAEKMAPDQSGHIVNVFTAQPDFLNFACENSALDLLESLMGPNICFVGASVFVKKAHSKKFVAWHADVGQQFEMFDQLDVVSMTLAITASTKNNGCVRYISGSHNKLKRQYEPRPYSDSLFGSHALSLKENEIDTSSGIVDMELDAGQCSFSSIRTVHSSHANTSSDDRILLVFKYLSAGFENGTAAAREIYKAKVKNRILVRGQDQTQISNLSIVVSPTGKT